MKYFLIAGEASGDLHGANLIKWLKFFDPEAKFLFCGGDLMAKQAPTLLSHYKDTAFMGVAQILKNASKIRQKANLCKQAILNFKPHAIIFIDYPGFNLPMAKWAKKHNFKTIYYISPKIWAWRKYRAKTIKQYIDRMFVIFPFEIQFYQKYNYSVTYHGNPTVEEINEFIKNHPDKNLILNQLNLKKHSPLIALLPGSRSHELKFILPVMNQIIQNFPNVQFVVAGMTHLDPKLYAPVKHLPIVWNKTYHLLSIADAAIVTSGTATLETALFNVPQVVLYKADWFQYYIGKLIVHFDYFSLVNIILNRMAVLELLQKNLIPLATRELHNILYCPQHKQFILDAYSELKKILGTQPAAKNTAEDIVSWLKKNSKTPQKLTT